MIDSKKFNRFYGVDSYSDTHDTDEYKFAFKDRWYRQKLQFT